MALASITSAIPPVLMKLNILVIGKAAIYAVCPAIGPRQRKRR
jgi:hypothetical protein